MNAELQRIVDDYLARLRRSMRGAPADLAAEAEREIVAHIEDALAARDEPSVGILMDVLARLGPPEEYGRDLALYIMVDRGYRQWYLPDMIRSAAYWAFSKISGALVVATFAVLYGGALLLLGLGLFIPVMPLLAGQSGLPPVVANRTTALLLVTGGLFALVGITAIVRSFVGQYVRSARPPVLGGAEADPAWVERTSRRIVVLALLGLVVTLVAGWTSGAYRLEPGGLPHFPPEFAASPLGLLSAAGLLVLLLAPVLGLAWTVLIEREGRRGGDR